MKDLRLQSQLKRGSVSLPEGGSGAVGRGIQSSCLSVSSLDYPTPSKTAVLKLCRIGVSLGWRKPRHKSDKLFLIT